MSSPPPAKRTRIVKIVNYSPKGKAKKAPDVDPTKCLVKNCTSSSTDPKTKQIKLPDITERRQAWLTKCDRKDLLDTKEYSKYFVCNEHFKPNEFTNTNRNKVRQYAVPSVFKDDVPSTSTPAKTYKASSKTPAQETPQILKDGQGKSQEKSQEDDDIMIIETKSLAPKEAPSTLVHAPAIPPVPGAPQFFLLTPSGPNAAGAGPLLVSAAQLQQQLGIPATPTSSLVVRNPASINAGEPPQPAPEEPKATDDPKNNKMVITVPKSLYKKYRSGKVTLADLTARAKKVVNKEGLAKLTGEDANVLGKEPVTVGQSGRDQLYRLQKSAEPLLDQVNRTLADKPEPVSVKRVPKLVEPQVPAKPLHQVELDLNTPQVSSQVHQVAPMLPRKAHGGTFNLHKWDVFVPRIFRDWPVPASVLYAAATQLKQNYNDHFTGKERLEIETVLHLVGHFTSLGASSRCHVRERVHFYLKKMQQELVLGKELEAKKRRKKATQAGVVFRAEDEQNQQPDQQVVEEQTLDLPILQDQASDVADFTIQENPL
ncbi:uncharacterized protein LOC132204079 isoform X2 [Neocloeon triangulifer]|uniref:uncharacterized protein LOC132204079 isoform X2 n=1 Tax=Neocloeon triangulifer TaxID=2078957 RepID=UPI00286F189C|nr:uncharacterized protein LOC132204079 isoform X2 [Neocloeon triangulifer]